MKYLIFLCIAFLSFGSYGQMYKNKKKRKQHFGNQRLHKPLYKWVTGNYTRHGIQLAFGPTYLMTNQNIPMRNTTLGDRPVQYQFDPAGKLGVYGEIGMVHITKRPRKLIQYYDWSLGYKHFGGKEDLRVDRLDNNGEVVSSEFGEGEFNLGYAFARFGVHNVFQMNPRNFIDHAIGVNLDYRVSGGNMEYEGVSLPNTQFFQDDLLSQVNYEFGLGIKMREGFFIIPGFRMPVMEITEWRGGNPSLEWFSSTYQPLLLKLKFVWLFKKDENRCPAVETNSRDREMMKNL